MCTNGDCHRRAFITSTTYTGNLGGLAGADAKCQARAAAVGLKGVYLAWISDSTGSPATRFVRSNAPYIRVDGVVIANNWADLTDSSIANVLNRDEFGNTLSPYQYPYTNTSANGYQASASGYSCTNWTTTSGSAWFGCNDYLDSHWSLCFGQSCGMGGPLYCFEQ